MTKAKSIRGMHDLIGEDFLSQKEIIKIFESTVHNFNFKPIETPIMEFNEVFSRTLGLSSDVVMKEMYTFIDRSNDQLTLRPEGTAGIARAIISNGLTQNLPLKYFYYGPMFRYERPQKGRLRQFNQVGVEVYSKPGIEKDFEVIYLASNFLKDLNILDNLILKINNLGNLEDRKNYKKILKEYYLQNKSKLSKDSIIRLEKNPLRILDSKDEQDKEILLNAPVITENLSQVSSQYFNQVKELLEDNGIDFTIDHKLVRGLDYYTDTAFEFQTNEDKRQNAILAGGRYDKLISLISTRDIPGIGWAAGVERLMSLINIENQKEKKSKVLFAVQNEKYLLKSEILKQIYELDCIHETKINKNIKKIFTYADKNNFNFILLIGEEEDSKNKIILKNLNTKEQKIFNQSDIKLVNEIR